MTEQLYLSKELVQPDRFLLRSGNIQDALSALGMPPHLLGYDYIMSALDMILSNPEYLHRLTKGLYADIALKHNTTSARVERAIRHAISVTWHGGHTDYINRLFKNFVNPKKGTPTNSLFLTRMYYFLR